MELNANIQTLKKEMLQRLRTIGAYSWEAPRMNNGVPTVNCVWDGQFYGFYPVGQGHNMKALEREAMKKMIDAGAICAAVSSVENMEAHMGLDIEKKRLIRLLPRKTLVEMLKRWGQGDPTIPKELEHEILALDNDKRKVIYGLYFDRMTFNEIAAELNTTYKNAVWHHHRAQIILRERLIKRHNIVGDHVLD